MRTQEAPGTEAITSFVGKFNAKGIRTVCGWSHIAESKSRYAVAAKGVTELKEQIAASEDGGLQRMRLEGELKIMEERASEYSTQAQEAARNAWRTHDALQLVARDLERFCNDLSAAVEAGIKATRKFYAGNGWGSPTDEYILSTVVPLQALANFKRDHAEPAWQMFRAQLAVSAAGQKLGEGFQPDAITWIICGCAWRDIKTA